MAGIFSALIDYMEEEEWRYEILEGETVLRFNVKTHSGRLLCYGEAQEDKDWLLFYSYLPVNVPEEKMPQAAEFVARANRGMRIGNFELDVEDGEVRYKTSIDVEGGELTPKMIDNLLHANLSTMDRYFNGFMELIYGDKSAAELIDLIERPPTAEELKALESLDLGDEDLDDDDDDDEDDEGEGEFDEGPGVYDEDDEDDAGGRRF
ncbi:MAG TPA: YbjN domain-containing protein [Gemmataceae bacterium]